jgi:hypothetical protein
MKWFALNAAVAGYCRGWNAPLYARMQTGSPLLILAFTSSSVSHQAVSIPNHEAALINWVNVVYVFHHVPASLGTPSRTMSAT